MMAQMTAMSGLDTDGDVTFGEMRRLQAQQQAEIRELIQPGRRKRSAASAPRDEQANV
jgi:hypothetical protein